MSFLNSITDLVVEFVPGLSRFKQAIIEHENEKRNLHTIIRLIIDKFLNKYARNSKELEIDAPELVDLLIVLEKVLFHGFRFKIPLSKIDELWMFLKNSARNEKSLNEVVKSVEALDHLSSVISRIRAFLRILTMTKDLDLFFERFSSLDLANVYETWSFVRSDDGQVLSSTLLALKVFDCNLLLDSDILDALPNNIDISKYMKPSLYHNDLGNESELEKERNFQLVLAQKQYLEEQNKKLTTQQKVNEKEDSKNVQNLQKLQELESALQKYKNKCEKLEEYTSLLTQQNSVLNRTLSQKSAEFNQNIGLINKQMAEKDRQVFDRIWAIEMEMNDYFTFESNKLDSLLRKMDIVRHQSIGRSNRSEEEFYDLISKMESKQQELQLIRQNNEDYLTKIEELQRQIHIGHAALQELAELRLAHDQTTQRLQETNQALIEIGPQLSNSKLQMVMMKEQLFPTMEWVKDSDVSNCTSCNAEFSVTLRRHHCRRCGQIFCDPCSKKKVSLPSHANQVRVCSQCYNLLETLQSTGLST
uniref:RUN and FYVE domain-containing protein 2 n=1 Tax=Panagrolaimus sp. JU765 TaxID=591449 RepID=A0AC34Q254_9BILA